MRYNQLKEKIRKSQNIIREAYQKYPHHKVFIAWTGGKDSTVLLHLVRSTFGEVNPFPVMFNDSTMEFEEIYEFIRRVSLEWKLKLIIHPHDQKELKQFHSETDPDKKLEMSRIMKINAIKKFIKKNPVKAFMTGIRWDEHTSRSKETYFSKRINHVRIHPILHFTEKDIWDYIKKYKVPYVRLYNHGYRSLGEKPFTKKASFGKSERSGREALKEKIMEKLRRLGYW